jgi:hypothetical protein
MLSLLASCNELMGIPMDLLQDLLIWDTGKTNNYGEHIQVYNSTSAFALMDMQIKSPPTNGPYCYWTHSHIYPFVSWLHQNKANIPGYGQLYISNSAEATTKPNQRCMAKVMQQLYKMLQHVNPFAESYKRMHQIE